MKITEEQVQHVAQLAKLEFQPDETAHFVEQLNDIIHMMEQLNEVDTTDVPITTHGYELVNVMREDIAEETNDRDRLLANAKTTENGLIQVPAILDSEVEGA